MRNYIITLFFILSISCDTRDGCEDYNWISYVPPLIAETEYLYNVVYNYNDRIELENYLNSNFFNRYNITIKLLEEGEGLTETLIVPDRPYRGSYLNGIIEIRMDRVYTSTVAHEIGHSLGLLHLDVEDREYQHIMYPIESDCGLRFYFKDNEIEKMKNYLDN